MARTDEARGTNLTIRRENDTLTLNGGVNAFGSEIDALAYSFDGDLVYPLDGGALTLRDGNISLSCGVGLVDGSQVVLSAANGDERTFDLTVTSGGRSNTLTIAAAPLMARTNCGGR